MADAVKALRQDVEQEAPDELCWRLRRLWKAMSAISAGTVKTTWK
jgi:hypothetical protein